MEPTGAIIFSPEDVEELSHLFFKINTLQFYYQMFSNMFG
jgi:hypothetical protein